MELRSTGIADINPADRKMMRLWNLHMTKYHGYGIKNMDNIVLEFVTNKKAEILQHYLYVNLVTHLVNLQVWSHQNRDHPLRRQHHPDLHSGCGVDQVLVSPVSGCFPPTPRDLSVDDL